MPIDIKNGVTTVIGLKEALQDVKRFNAETGSIAVGEKLRETLSRLHDEILASRMLVPNANGLMTQIARSDADLGVKLADAKALAKKKMSPLKAFAKSEK